MMRIIVTESDCMYEDYIYICEDCGLFSEQETKNCGICGCDNIVKQKVTGDAYEL
jgi:predicted RNA-binding protein with PUA domain